MTIDLSRLLELADKAVQPPWDSVTVHVWQGSRQQSTNATARFVLACDPDTIRALVKCVKAAKSLAATVREVVTIRDTAPDHLMNDMDLFTALKIFERDLTAFGE